MKKTLLTLLVLIIAISLCLATMVTANAADINSGLISHWSFDDNTNDASASANNLTATGTTYVEGKFGKALSFNGTASSFANAAVALPECKDFTVSTWVKVNSFTTDGPKNWDLNTIFATVGGYDPSVVHFMFKDDGSKTAAHSQLAVAPIPDKLSSGSIAYGEWHLITCVIDSNAKTQTYYLDGEAEDPIDITPIAIKPGKLKFGLWDDSKSLQRFFDGAIDDVRIYNRALSADDVKALVDLSGGTTTTPATTAAATTAPATTEAATATIAATPTATPLATILATTTVATTIKTETTTTPVPKADEPNNLGLIIGIIAVLAIAGGAGFYFIQKSKKKEQ